MHELRGPAQIGELADDLPAGSVLVDPDLLSTYRYDWTRDPRAGTPTAVVRATCTSDVQKVLKWASEHGVPVVPRGAGSSLSGGASGIDGGVTLSLERMRDVTVDPVNRVAVVGPGAITADGEVGRVRARPLVPTRSVVGGAEHHRRERGDQRGRPVLREVWRHQRLRPRDGGRSRRWNDTPPWRPSTQGRRGTGTAQALRRVRRHARGHHRAHAPPAPAPG